MKKIKIGISIGDLNGIGPEIIIKSLSNSKINNFCIPVIYGSSKVISYHKNIVGAENFEFYNQKNTERLHSEKVNLINCWHENVNITLGKPTEEGGKYAQESLSRATNDLLKGRIDALVTAPINKGAMNMAGFEFPGHTEYLTDQSGMKDSLMLMVSDSLKIGLLSNHLPLKNAAQVVTKSNLIRKLELFNASLKQDFGIERPTIAVLALNPHAGDQGLIGEEEDKVIRPAIIELKKKGLFAIGPFPADGFFGSGQYKKFDGILAMYHDQGLIPFKALSFGSGVNFTAGLPIIRTSPDHGTAYEIAGQNAADSSSFLKALFLAIDIVRNRAAYKEMHENMLVKTEKPSEAEEAG